jgi:hypothetical protein
MDSVKTKKGTVLPLMNLKGKPYMMVAHRIVWFNEDVEGGSFEMSTEQLVLTEERAVIKATVEVYDKDGRLLKQGVGTKAETKKDFPDFIEKAETGAIGRAITMMGYGTAYAIADLDEGERIIDSPVTTVKPTASSSTSAASTPTAPSTDTGGFKRPTKTTKTEEATASIPLSSTTTSAKAGQWS